MVKANVELVTRLMEAKTPPWSITRLAYELGVVENSARRIMRGEGISHDTQVALCEVFQRQHPGEDLLLLDVGGGESEGDARQDCLAHGAAGEGAA